MRAPILQPLLIAISLILSSGALAHGVAEGDVNFLSTAQGQQILPYLYLGAKHMVTGYDHLLFLLGVVFFVYRMKDVAIYVTLFAIGHSITLLAGVLSGWHVNPYLVDAIIGLSVVYKAFDNIGGFKQFFGFQPNTRIAVAVFGLFHGLGLAAKLQDLSLNPDHLITNMLAFNVGVEVGQLLALGAILLLMNLWRTHQSFAHQAFAANVMLMASGFTLMGYQLTGLVSQ